MLPGAARRRAQTHSSARRRQLWLLLAVVAAFVSPGCASDTTLAALEGIWDFTYTPSTMDGAAVTRERLHITVDGNDVLITPVENGQSAIDKRRSGTVDGTASDFTLKLENWPQLGTPPEGCTVQSAGRTLLGGEQDGQLSGTYEQHEVLKGQGCADLEASGPGARGVFGAVPVSNP